MDGVAAAVESLLARRREPSFHEKLSWFRWFQKEILGNLIPDVRF